MNLIDRFLAKVEKTEGCWLWTGWTDKKAGYGMFWMAGAMRLSHRVSYELFVGQIIGGLHVLHRCDNPSCVNPEHLWLGTNADNVADKVAKDRCASMPGEKHPGAKLTADDVRFIRSCELSGPELARRFGVDRSTVNYIRKGKLWSHVQ